MRTKFALMKCVAKAVLKYAGNAIGGGFAGDVIAEVFPEIIADVWESFGKQSEADRRLDLEETARVAPGEEVPLAAEITREVAGDQPEEVRRAVAACISRVPSLVRSSLRRPADPAGRTAPPSRVPRSPEELIRLLPVHALRFKPGDRPIPGVDLELVELLGVGGVGEVWKARNVHDAGLPPVALKFCLDPAVRHDLLLHEARVLGMTRGRDGQPGIVSLRQTYLGADPSCLEYEYVEGGDLSGLIAEWGRRRGGMPPQYAARLILEMATIVGYTHRLRPAVIHRDLKPANVLVQASTEGGFRLRITDFGLGALSADVSKRQDMAGLPGSLLKASVVNGSYTPLYASPQQERGGPPDPRDDVHALGVIWYQMLRGDLGKSSPRGRRWHEQLAEGGMLAGLIDLLAECIDEEPEVRPSDAAVLAERLGSALSGRSASQRLNDGKALFEAGEHDEAIKELMEALARWERDKVWWDLPAIQVAIPGGRAIEPSNATLGSAVLGADIHYWLGRAYHAKRDRAAAVCEYEEAIRLDGRRADCHFWLGRAALDEDRSWLDSGGDGVFSFGGTEAELESAISRFEQATAMAPHVAEYWYWLGEARHRLGLRGRAEPWALALEAYAQASTLEMQSAELCCGIGHFFLLSGDHETALLKLEEAFEADNDDAVQSERIARCLMRLGESFTLRGDHGLATRCFGKAAVCLGGAAASYPELFVVKAMAHFKAGELAESYESFLRFMDTDYDWYDVFGCEPEYILAFGICGVRFGDDMCIPYLETVSGMGDGLEPIAAYWLGRAYLTLGDYARAAEQFARSFELSGDRSKARQWQVGVY